MKSFSKKTRQQASDQWLKRISWLVLFGLVASLVYWWWHDAGARQQGLSVEPQSTQTQEQSQQAQPQQTQSGDSVPAPVSQPAMSSPGAAIDGTEQPAEGAVDGTAEDSVTDATATDATATDATVTDGVADADAATASAGASATVVAPESNDPASAPLAVPNGAEAAAASAVVANARLLSLSFTADCWIKVTDSKGKVLSEGVKNARQPLALEGEPPFSVILGAPRAARIEYMNQEVDLSSFNAGRAARLTVPQS